MADENEIRSEAVAVLSRTMPTLQIARLDVTEAVDSSGNASLWIRIIAQKRPPREEARNMPVFVDELRSWLALHHDDRFPYVRLLTVEDEQELQRAG